MGAHSEAEHQRESASGPAVDKAVGRRRDLQLPRLSTRWGTFFFTNASERWTKSSVGTTEKVTVDCPACGSPKLEVGAEDGGQLSSAESRFLCHVVATRSDFSRVSPKHEVDDEE